VRYRKQCEQIDYALGRETVAVCCGSFFEYDEQGITLRLRRLFLRRRNPILDESERNRATDAHQEVGSNVDRPIKRKREYDPIQETRVHTQERHR
jgi:hypothetical protein